MPKIVFCELCGDSRWEDQKCPSCLKVSNTQARLNVLRDAQDLGAGWSRTLADGTVEHVDPSTIYIKEVEGS